MSYEGVATGQFDVATVSHNAAAAKMAPRSMAPPSTVSAGLNHTCITVVDGALGVLVRCLFSKECQGAAR